MGQSFHAHQDEQQALENYQPINSVEKHRLYRKLLRFQRRHDKKVGLS